MAMPNPYTPGSVPRYLAGRESETGRVRDALARVATFGEMAGAPLVFQGPRGVGKTSLLRSAQQDAEEHGFVTAWVAGRRGAPVVAELATAVSDSIAATDVLDDRSRQRLHLRLTEVALEVGLPTGVKVRANVAPRLDTNSPSLLAPTPALERLLHEASRRIRESGGAGLVVFVDELHAPTHQDLAVLLNAVQNLGGRREENPIAIVGAGLPSTAGELTRSATFAERCTFVSVDRLSAEAAASAITEPAQSLGVTWRAEAVQRLTAYAQGFPYLLQVAAHETWNQAHLGDKKQSITIDDAERGLSEALRLVEAMYAARWSAASELEKQFISAMATSEGSAVSRTAIAAALGRTSNAISAPRDRLIEKGIIEPAPERGFLRFTLPGFGDFLRSEHVEETDPSHQHGLGDVDDEARRRLRSADRRHSNQPSDPHTGGPKPSR